MLSEDFMNYFPKDIRDWVIQYSVLGWTIGSHEGTAWTCVSEAFALRAIKAVKFAMQSSSHGLVEMELRTEEALFEQYALNYEKQDQQD